MKDNKIIIGQLPPAQVKNSGYSEAGASLVKRSLRSFRGISGPPNEDIDWNNQTLRERSRLLCMSSPIAASAIKTNRTNVIGQGLRLKTQISKEILGISPETALEWQQHTEAEFELWASDKHACDATGVNDFYSLQQLALMSWLQSGDAFCVFQMKKPTLLTPYSTRLHLIEADRISTPNSVSSYSVPNFTDGLNSNGNQIYDGVEIDKSGAIVAYHICNRHRSTATYISTSEWVRVEAYGAKTGTPNILHIMESERPGQYRGVPYLAPVIEALLQITRYTESELTAAVIQSFFTAFVKTENPEDGMPYNEAMGYGEQAVDRTDDEYALGPATINIMQPGESIEFANPTRPTSNFDSFTKAMIRQVGSALEIPNELLIKEFSSSYSASRGALLEAWKAFRMRRDWFVSDFCQPVYNKWLDEAVAIGRINAPGYFNNPLIRKAWQGAIWQGPAPGMLDPTKEIEAEEKAIANGFSTRQQSAVKLNGGDWNKNVQQIAEEKNRMKELGLSESED